MFSDFSKNGHESYLSILVSWHSFQACWNLIIFYFYIVFLEIISAMNESHFHYKINNLWVILYRSSYSQWFYKTGVLKNFTNMSVWFLWIQPELYYKTDSSTSVLWNFKNTSFLEKLWSTAFTVYSCIKLNKYREVSFLCTFFYRKSKTKQERRVASKLKKP